MSVTVVPASTLIPHQPIRELIVSGRIWLMVLDDRRDERFDDAIRKYEVEHNIETLSPYQKRFIAKGKQEGRQEGQQEALLEVLEDRFKVVPADTAEAVRHIISPELLTQLLRAALHVSTIDEFRSLLPS